MLIICDSEGGKGEGRCNVIIHVCDRKEGGRYNMTIILMPSDSRLYSKYI